MQSFFRKFLYRFLYPAALIYTVISLMTFLGFYIFGSDNATKQTAFAFFMIAGYAVFISFVGLIFYTKIIMSIKLPSHFLCVFIPFYIVIKKMMPTTYIWCALAFVVIYAAVATLAIVLNNKKKAKERDSKNYRKLYSK
ncbi:MAG: hypothetical protein PUB34_07450 [Clostridia bacterium]|nr:hypothetical protein [Clostridia bacterium]